METAIMEQEQKLEQESRPVIDEAKAIVISSQHKYMAATEFLQTIKAMQQKVKETFEPICKKAHAAWVEATGQRNKFLDPLEAAERVVKQKMAAYLDEQDRKRREEEARQAEELRKQQEKARKQAEKEEAKGNIEKADLIRQEAQESALRAPAAQVPQPKAEGIKKIEKWHYKITSLDRLPKKYMIPNDKMLQDLASATKGKVDIPGVQFYSETLIAASAKPSRPASGSVPRPGDDF